MATRLLSTQRVVNLASDPATGTAGELYYNTASNVFKYYNGTSWTEIVGGGEGASLTISETAPSPASSGDLWLNSATLKLLVYYDSFWVEIGGGGGGGSDADTLDGQNGTYYLDWTNTTNKPDPTITLAGDLTGSVTLTDLASGTLTATIAANSVELGTDTTGQYVAAISGTANQITVSGSGVEGVSETISLPSSVIFPGTVTLNDDPTQPLHAVTKRYVDNNLSNTIIVSSTVPAVAAQGTLYFNSTDYVAYISFGGAWLEIGSVPPFDAGAATTTVFDTTFNGGNSLTTAFDSIYDLGNSISAELLA